MSDLLLDVKSLEVSYPIYGGVLRHVVDQFHAVKKATFQVFKGSTVGLVGESGSGKSTLGRALIQLTKATGGEALYQGVDLLSLPQKDFFPYRKKIQMIFQDPFNSLNPRLNVFSIIGEALEIHFPLMTPSQRRERVAQLLKQVGLQADHLDRFPHEFSGGQRQRIGIARALAVEPEFIICDEPVSALDVSVQAQIVNLLQDLQDQLGLTYLFIAHDLAVVEHMSDYVLVMNKGEIVEQGTPEEIYLNPKQDYTQKLLSAIPKL
ncbi:MAG: ATP-binding cassette domain-containing protein [Verrucomicrobiota bacterium]